ncbi:hypothetical protein SDRG_16496 [Saprolegnia diclina VS20]|uniref:Prolyl 4-hydroxylase alpha subunit domain-containing protein n=1 Tax=Saprolegnia diclina (strain VS20) TaxID=1156394 RepID=T0PTT1_SAPDV|nr:hypothetical protein SDRG_16496 [Saprolegnia diclina VS20]EQC25641.1 hypothetical protein SDRG_16496 [Saprolegnia diclina VS20]|eukprot:XP_008620932.1 hypothetical protein SDRG_16496 [Saprolegnia diclina VS20]
MVALGIAIHLYRPSSTLRHQDVQETALRAALARPPATTLVNSTQLVDGALVSKYETNLVHVDPQFFLEPLACAYDPRPSSERVPVAPLMQLPIGTLAANASVFVMLNGENDGLFLPWHGDSTCLHTIAMQAARALGAHPSRIANGVRLVSQYSLPITSADDLEVANRIVHVLLDFQLLSPKVFGVEGFFTHAEANAIIAEGTPGLQRSVVGAGLPSPSFAERLQLVRYKSGEYYRKHLDTMSSKNILPPHANDKDFDDYLARAKIPTRRRAEPAAARFKRFPNALLQLFLDSQPHFFTSRQDVASGVGGTMRLVLKQRPTYLPSIIQAWEAAANRIRLRYAFPTTFSTARGAGMSHFLRWIRWVKEKVSILGVDAVPASVAPAGSLYPKFDDRFQFQLLSLLEAHASPDALRTMLTPTWFDFFQTYKTRRDCLHLLLQNVPGLVRHLIAAWEAAVDDTRFHYTLPSYVKHTSPNRFATLFVYLNDVAGGGTTAFPHAAVPSTLSPTTSATNNECNQGLSVVAKGLSAAFFYVMTPDMDIDPLSEHGGAPRLETSQ